jgi:hypothetical protein
MNAAIIGQLLLLVSVLLVVFSAFTLNTFLNLRQANRSYPTNHAYEDACHLSNTRTNGGIILSSIFLGIGVILTLLSLWILTVRSEVQISTVARLTQ